MQPGPDKTAGGKIISDPRTAMLLTPLAVLVGLLVYVLLQ
jgi:hypothetical protein